MSPSLLLVLLLAAPALLTPLTSQELEVRGQRTPRDTKQDSIKVVISEGCADQGDSSDVTQGGKEIDLSPGSPLVLTHKIKLVPSGSGSGSGSCGCEADFASLRERLERLEREVSNLREKCGGAEGGCCTSKESKGASCSIKPGDGECPNECSDQGRCVNGKCVCFSGFSGPDCSQSNCPGNCNNKGKCVNGQCVCDPGFTGPDCSQGGCPDNCNNKGRCVNGQCVCDSGFTGPSCSDKSCPGNCNNRGRCIDGKCVCNPGFTGPDCSKRGCPDNCNNRGRCVNGRCVCQSGFSGADCSETGCPGNCNNKGRCVDGECVCDEGFGGPDCSEIICLNDCYDRGKCVNGQCVCDEGFTGEDCSETACPGNCNNRGRCVNGQCVCDAGFAGEDCSEAACPGNCNNRGRCVNGKCVCNAGFTGDDCSEKACPGNCKNRGRCVNGKCVCDDGFTGEDCSEKACPGNCKNRGRCVNGQCVCDDGFTGEDCSEKACPGNCNNRGRCVNGQCVCNDGFTGKDCSEKACPANCSNQGKCVNGKCVCDVGFAGPDCAAKGCPGNCSNKGRCVKGKCICRRGFTGPDCSQCEEGMTGPNCDTAMSGVSQLSTRDITETSATLVWTPPPVRYETYYITFTSQKESDQQINVKVDGSLTTFTQTGLAAGQEYTASITGEIDGRRGAESTAEFMTLISGPSNLQVVKTTTTSAVVQWEQSQGEIDRYRLTVTPSDGAGRSKEMTVPAGRDSAHIQELEAGRLYDITLVAEKGASQSGPAVTQVTPGAEGGESERGSGKDRLIDGSKKDSTASLITRTKPYPSKKVATNGTRPAERPAVSKKPNVPGPFRSNTTRVIPGGRKIGPGPLKKLPVGQKKKVPIPAKRPQPGVPTAGNRTTALKVTDPSKEAPSTDKTDAKNPTVISGTDSTTERESSSEGPSFTVGSKEQPDVGKDGQGNDTASVSSEPTGTVQSQDKKCLNKIKVTHVRLPVKDRGSGCRGGGQVLAGKIPDSHLTSSETDESPDLDYTPDPLHKLLTDTFDSLNITTFAVHLSKTSDLSTEAETVREQILDGLKPLSTFRSSSTAEADSQQPPHSTSSQSSPSHGPSSSSQTNLIPSLPVPSPLSPLPQSSPSPSSPSSPSSAAHSSPEKSGSSESAEAKTEHIKSTVSVASPEEEGGPPTSPRGRMHPHLPRPTDPAHGRTKTGQLQNNNNQNLRVPQRPVFYSNLNLRRKAETKHPSTGELPSTASPSSSEESLSGEVTGPVRPSSGDKDKTTAPASSGAEQDQTKISTERGKPPFRRVPPKGGYPRRTSQNFGPFNRTRPNQRLLPPPARPLKPVSETKEEQLPSSEPPAPSSSPPVSEVSNKAEETVPREEVNSDKGGLRVSTTVMTTEFNRTLRGNGGPSSHRPGNVGPFRRPVYGGRFLNRNQTNLRPPYRGPLRKPLPTRTLNGGSSIPAEGPTNQLEKQTADQIPEIPSGGQDSPTSPKGVQIRPSGRQDTAEVVPRDQIHGRDSDGKPEIHSPERRGDTLIQAPKLGAEETKIRDPNSDQREEKVSGGENAGGTSQGGPTTKGLDSGDPDHKPVTFSRRPSPTRGTATQHQSRLRPYLSGGLRRDNTRPNNTAKGGLYSKTAASRPPTGVNVSSPGVTREPLDNVGVTNRSLDRFTLVWDSPEGKYKNFVVTRSKVEKTKSPEKTGRKTDRGEEPGESEREDGGGEEVSHRPTKEKESERGGGEDENRVPESAVAQFSKIQTSTTDKPLTESDKPFREVLPGSARSFLFEDLPPKTDYTVTLLGKGPGILSRLHKLVISTGPEPPTDIVFSELTENSLTVSWTKPKSPVSGFKVTYTHVEEGEPVSVSVDSGDSSVGLSKLSPGSTYEVNIISVLGLDESDPLKDVVTTLPDPPTDLRAVNVTDSTALLLWRPALAAVDKYVIVYGAGTDSELRISVSGNAAEQQLSGLEGSTTYTVTITSQLGSQESSKATTSFTTTGGSGGDGDGPRDLLADNVTPRTATLSWKPPSKPVGSYRLTYRTEDQDMKEVTVDGSLTKFNLSRLHPGSKYTVQLQAENGGVYTTAISTEFTTGTLRFPFPTDCSQELLNGIRISGELEIFPQGKQGRTMMVFCDMETDGGGWTVFQRRKDGSVDFFRGWKDYTKGFGDLSGEFWLGLENLHNLTTMTKMNLRVDMRDGAESVFAKYSTFEVARRNYKLSVGGYSGTAGDSLSYHNNRLFSTKDRDPTPFITRCAMSYRAGWWYKNCHEANLNGLYGIDVKHQGIIWTTWKGKEHSIQFVEMKMRPASFRG